MFGFVILPFLMLLFSTLRRNKVLIFLSFLLLWLIAGLRDSSVGTDTFNYEFAFNSFSRGVDRNVEPFWKYLNLLV
ncbi:MAG TPA: EpsG family protein, partial [Sphingobacteriaceae bacterium]|nr:EpsG family protein [Sphingobacteriaceae bacterium]